MVSREIHEVQTNRRKFSEPVWFQKSFILCHARAAWCCILVPHPQNTTRSCDLLCSNPLVSGVTAFEMLFKLILFALRSTFSNWYALNVNFDLFSCDVTGGQVETCRCSIFSIFKQLKFRRNEKYFHYYSLDSPNTRGCRGRLRGATTIAPRVSRGMETNESLMLVPSNFLHSYTFIFRLWRKCSHFFHPHSQ